MEPGACSLPAIRQWLRAEQHRLQLRGSSGFTPLSRASCCTTETRKRLQVDLSRLAHGLPAKPCAPRGAPGRSPDLCLLRIQAPSRVSQWHAARSSWQSQLRGSGGFAPHFPKPGADFIDEAESGGQERRLHSHGKRGMLRLRVPQVNLLHWRHSHFPSSAADARRRT